MDGEDDLPQCGADELLRYLDSAEQQAAEQAQLLEWEDEE